MQKRYPHSERQPQSKRDSEDINYGLIGLSIKLPLRFEKVDRQYLKKNLRISLANKFKTPEDLERYVKGKHGKPI